MAFKSKLKKVGKLALGAAAIGGAAYGASKFPMARRAMTGGMRRLAGARGMSGVEHGVKGAVGGGIKRVRRLGEKTKSTFKSAKAGFRQGRYGS